MDEVIVKPKTGDWVRFYQQGRLVVGVVQYVRDGRLSYLPKRVCTDVGEVDAGSILEVR